MLFSPSSSCLAHTTPFSKSSSTLTKTKKETIFHQVRCTVTLKITEYHPVTPDISEAKPINQTSLFPVHQAYQCVKRLWWYNGCSIEQCQDDTDHAQKLNLLVGQHIRSYLYAKHILLATVEWSRYGHLRSVDYIVISLYKGETYDKEFKTYFCCRDQGCR